MLISQWITSDAKTRQTNEKCMSGNGTARCVKYFRQLFRSVVSLNFVAVVSFYVTVFLVAWHTIIAGWNRRRIYDDTVNRHLRITRGWNISECGRSRPTRKTRRKRIRVVIRIRLIPGRWILKSATAKLPEVDSNNSHRIRDRSEKYLDLVWDGFGKSALSSRYSVAKNRNPTELCNKTWGRI